MAKEIKEDAKKKDANAAAEQQGTTAQTEEKPTAEEVIDIPLPAEDAEKPIANDEREVQPKKVPVGAFKLPGFFTKSKPKAANDESIANESANIENKDDSKISQKNNEDDCKKQNTIGARLLQAIAGVLPKRKQTQQDVECGGQEQAAEKDKDEVDRAIVKSNGAEVINELKQANGEEVKQKVEVEQAEQQRISRFRASSSLIPALVIGLTLLVAFVLTFLFCPFFKTNSNSNLPNFMQPLRDGLYMEVVSSCGLIAGVKRGNVYTFEGIPYARAPRGIHRFTATRSIDNINECWEGIYNAYKANSNYNKRCVQMLNNGSKIGDENCLFLDIVTPTIRYDRPVPVVVLISAETLNGPSPGLLEPSAEQAEQQKVIFVRPNFRLGALGFLATQSITKTSYPRTSGNYALADIIAALKWIQLNINHFGGDTKSITLLGHRAGATLVSLLATSKLAEGLYTRAWASSASAIYPGKPLAEYENLNEKFAVAANCQTYDCLMDLEINQIWAATPDTWLQFPAALPSREESQQQHHEWLVLDGYIIRDHPSVYWKKKHTGLPKLVMGTTAQESHTFNLRERHPFWTPAEVRAYIESSQIGALNLTDEVIQLYNATNYKALVSMISDIRTICPLLTNARLQPTVPFYVVTQGSGDDQIAHIDSDILAILGSYPIRSAAESEFVDNMQQIFYTYVRDGTFRQYDPRRRVINVGSCLSSQEDYKHCNYWISKDIVPRYARID